MPERFTESVVEDATLDWFAELGYTVALLPKVGAKHPPTGCNYSRDLMGGCFALRGSQRSTVNHEI